MNSADFNTQPDGFPLESDATLGFMQSSYLEGIRALAKLSGQDNIILSGLIRTGSSVTEGWILKDGDLVYFESGSYLDTYIIETATVQKSNQNGALIDRYFTKVARFGTSVGTEYDFADLVPVNSLRTFQEVVSFLATAGLTGTRIWTVVDGLQPVSGGVGGISGGRVLYQGQWLTIQPYGSAVSSGSPIYLTPEGEWSVSDGTNNLLFNPHTTEGIRGKVRKAAMPLGSILFLATTDFPSSSFSGNTGLGDWAGWRIADGTLGTIDLTGVNANLTPIQNKQA